jgi:hypothetical protein
MTTIDLERLGDEIAEISAHLDAATAHLLELIREFDARDGWNNGFRSCAHWLSWRVGLELGAARERVRVARALATLPALAQALARGELSYAKVRALTRVGHAGGPRPACSSSARPVPQSTSSGSSRLASRRSQHGTSGDRPPARGTGATRVSR